MSTEDSTVVRPTRTPITSKLLKSVGYDADRQVLEVEFNSGAVYQYAGVSPEKYAALTASNSLGSHFLRHIKPHHDFTRMDS